MNKRKLRVHHLLCIPLFVGEGYSGTFCENMARVIKNLEESGEEPVTVVCGADDICAGCPNLTGDGNCRNISSHGITVVEKDQSLAAQLGIAPGKDYTYQELKRAALEKLTREMFEDSCGRCRWYAGGLCSYEKWTENQRFR